MEGETMNQKLKELSQQAGSSDVDTLVLSGSEDSLHTKHGANAVKLFVGQIPKTALEDQLKPIFAQFGEICEIAVIKDRMTGEHRGTPAYLSYRLYNLRNSQQILALGCAFVTYQDRAAADKAILALHDVKCIPPMTNPLQVRYAEGELEKIGFFPLQLHTLVTTLKLLMYLYYCKLLHHRINETTSEHKLFIGMVPKHVGEDQLRRIFEPFGTVRELVVLREPSGVSRGCAFVKYDTREEALNAINGCNGRVYIAVRNTFPFSCSSSSSSS